MPRRPRIKLAGMPQHIVQRGINREACFHTEHKEHGVTPYILHTGQLAMVDQLPGSVNLGIYAAG